MITLMLVLLNKNLGKNAPDPCPGTAGKVGGLVAGVPLPPASSSPHPGFPLPSPARASEPENPYPGGGQARHPSPSEDRLMWNVWGVLSDVAQDKN